MKCTYLYFANPDIYLLYAKLEEEHGLARHAMEIYNRATEAVDKEEKHLVSRLPLIISA
jgi:hypothetical protein